MRKENYNMENSNNNKTFIIKKEKDKRIVKFKEMKRKIKRIILSIHSQ